MTKQCTCCGVVKDSLEFYSHSGKNSGLSSQCIACISKYNKSKNKTDRICRKREDTEYLPEEKKCPKCGRIKLQSEFYFNNRLADGLYSYCKDCQKGYAKNNNRNNQLKSKYGLTENDFNILLKSQDHRCLICGKEKKLVVDHDHKTGKIRGLLCSSCNTALGMFYDNTDSLQKAIRYLSEKQFPDYCI